MRARTKRGFRPRVEGFEDRCLLSFAVVEIQNSSTYNINFSFRWTPSSSWTSYTEGPGQGEILWTTYSTGLTPQALYDTTTWSGSQTTVNLAQGYGEWDGAGNPPASAATLYQFQNTPTGVELYYAAPPTPTQAVVEVLNESMYTITFDFRWTSSSSWASYTEGPGQGEIFWTTYSSDLTPQALYNTTTWSGSQMTVNLAQGYGEWTGNGTPPASSATLYQFQNTSTGVELYYAPIAPTPTPGPAPSASPSPNWSGYVVASNSSEPQQGSVTAVSGTWNVPAVTGPPTGTFDSSTWVGIDGDTDETVEQIGTEQDVIDGTPVYRAWWEMYSSGIKQPEQVITGMTIMPGDSISASVQYITSGPFAGDFYLWIIDNSRPNDYFGTYQSSYLTQSPLAERSTAEWIMEAPSVNGSIAAIPTFSTVNFTNASATIDGVTGGIDSPSWQATALDLVSNGIPLDATSALTSSGNGFSVSSNSDIGAGIATPWGVQTAQTQVGSNDPQVIVVGGQWNSHPPTQLVVVGQPPSVVAGAGFGLTIDVEDASGHVVSGYDGAVTLDLITCPGGAGLTGPLTVNAVNGVATFSGLIARTAGTYALQAVSTGLNPASFDLAVTPAQSTSYWFPPILFHSPPILPIVTGVAPLEQTAVLRHGRRAKKSAKLEGFTISFNEALDPASAANPGNYELYQTVKRRHALIPRSVPFNVVYDPTTWSVSLLIAGNPKLSTGGSLVVVTSNLLGSSGVRGVGQSAYTILPHAEGVVS
jgi:hypothetical protein